MNEKERKELELLYSVLQAKYVLIEGEQTRFLNASNAYVKAIERYSKTTLDALDAVRDALHKAGIED